jgi:hypothetical protein
MKKSLAAILVLVGLLSTVSHVEASTTLTYDPSMAVRAGSTEYAWMASNWQNFLSLDNWSMLGNGPRAFVTWNVDLATVGAIESAAIKIQKNNQSTDYGIPAGSHLEFALVTQYWDLTAGENQVPKNYWGAGPTTDTPILVTAPDGAYFEADVTALMQTWQASPSSYFGIMFRATDSGGGVIDPGNPESNGGITGDLMLTVPEPASLSLLALGGLAMLRRRKTA